MGNLGYAVVQSCVFEKHPIPDSEAICFAMLVDERSLRKKNLMFEGSIVIGVTLLSFAIWLHWNERRGWAHESLDDDLDHRYFASRLRSRRWVHLLFALCGILVIVAAFAGPGRVWIGCWMSVMVALLVIMVLAGVDAFRTLRYQSKKKPEIRRQIFEQDE